MLQHSHRHMKHVLILFVLAIFMLLVLPVQEVEARKGFGGGFGRSSFSRSTSGFGRSSFRSPGKSKSAFWGRSSTRAKSSSRWSGGNMAKRVGRKGTVFNSKKQAETAYRNKLKTSWRRKPSKRPDYVPQSISNGGRNYNVSFRNGGYGYWGPGNIWIALAAGSMLANSSLMANQGYYYGTPGGTSDSRGYRSNGPSWFMIFLIGFVLARIAGNITRR